MDICPVCRQDTTEPVLTRHAVPIFQNLLLRTEEEARAIPRGELELRYCGECGFVFNGAFDPNLLRYGTGYDNSQDWSPYFERYLDALVRSLVEVKGVRDCRVVEIGCGRGTFLRKLVEYPGAGVSGHGIDPCYTGPSSELAGRLTFQRSYFTPENPAPRADVVICRHVIEHDPTPVGLLRSAREVVANQPRPRVFFETPCLGWIAGQHAVWDLFYEHCSYFTAESITNAFAIGGVQVELLETVCGGQYLWAEGIPGSERPPDRASGSRVRPIILSLAERERALTASLEQRVASLVGSAQGGLALWGAGAKGVTFANLIDPDRKWIACVVDLNPRKQHGFLPGTGHPVVDYRELPEYGVTTAIVMNPNYREENCRLLREAALDSIRIVDPLEQD